MLRIVLLSALILVSSSSLSASILRKSLSRRQSEQTNCYVIEGFDCSCSYRLTCTTNRDLPSPITILPNEKYKYQSINLVILAHNAIKVTDRTFEPIKELFKPDEDTLEFRVKFENFTALDLSSPGILNRVFPDNTQARKVVALEIYNPAVIPSDNLHLFQNLNADVLELYAYHPFHGSFQQLFDGANIKYLRLSGVDINSDLSQPFTGNVGRLELAKQASQLSAQNFPVYPAHEMIINAFYISDFNTDNPPNYSNLVELRVSTNDRIPANAFQQYPNLRILSVSTEKDIDPNAFNGLNHLDKLTVKQPHPSIGLLNSVPNVKELETNVKNYGDQEQCQLVEKLAHGQVAVSNLPHEAECSCILNYINAAAGRNTCDAKDCDRSTCAAIRNNYDPSLKTFKTPPTVVRADGSNAFYPREQQVYTTPYQVPAVDREKLEKTMTHHSGDHAHRPHVGEHSSEQADHGHHPSDSQEGQNQDFNRHDVPAKTNEDADNQQSGADQANQSETDGSENPTEKEGGENQGEGQDNQSGSQDANTDSPDNASEESQTAPKKTGMRWLPIIIIIAAIIALILFGLLFYFFRKKDSNKGYSKAAASEPAAAATTAQA